MKLILPPFSLIRTQVSETEWRFDESEEGWNATQEFDGILEIGYSTGKLSTPLRAFLKRHPWHYDALTHYSMCKLNERKVIDAYAYACTAVATARAVFPPEFDPNIHTIPGGFVQNRPFLRSLHNLMLCAEALGDDKMASTIGAEMMRFDREDRMGARFELPKYLIRQGRNREALALFEDKYFEGHFYCAEYLRPIALLNLGRRQEAIESIEDCLRKPQVARYLLDPMAVMPPSDSPLGGVTSGSPLEGYLYAREYREFWIFCDEALNLLIEASQEAKMAGWPRYMPHKQKLDPE